MITFHNLPVEEALCLTSTVSYRLQQLESFSSVICRKMAVDLRLFSCKIVLQQPPASAFTVFLHKYGVVRCIGPEASDHSAPGAGPTRSSTNCLPHSDDCRPFSTKSMGVPILQRFLRQCKHFRDPRKCGPFDDWRPIFDFRG